VLSRISNWYRKWVGLQRWEKKLLPVLVYRLLWTSFLVRCRDISHLLKNTDAGFMNYRRREMPHGMEESELSIRCEHLVSIAASHGVVRATCLPRALVLYRLLQEFRVHCTLQLGVSPGSGQPLQAHAWVEFRDSALGEHPAGFKAFRDLPLNPAKDDSASCSSLRNIGHR